MKAAVDINKDISWMKVLKITYRYIGGISMGSIVLDTTTSYPAPMKRSPTIISVIYNISFFPE
jgi:hypothetical protein